MTKPSEAMFYLNVTWYGLGTEGNRTKWYENFQNYTGWSDDDITAFFDQSDPNSFGGLIAQENGLNSVRYSCKDETNCTGAELANLQWGSSYVTMHPRNVGKEASIYFPKSYTISKWGNFSTAGAPIALEFKWYQQQY